MVAQLDADIEAWAERWRSQNVPPPTPEQARLLRETFKPVRGKQQRRIAA